MALVFRYGEALFPQKKRLFVGSFHKNQRHIVIYASTHMMVPSGWLLARAENNHWHWLQYYMIIILFRVSTVIYGRIPNSHTVVVRLVPRTNWKGLANIGQNVDYMSSNYLGHYNNVPLILSLLLLLSRHRFNENWKAFSMVSYRYNFSYYAYNNETNR